MRPLHSKIRPRDGTRSQKVNRHSWLPNACDFTMNKTCIHRSFLIIFFKIKENNLIFLLRFTICNNMLLDKLVVFFQTRYISNAYHYFLIDKNDMELWIESTKDPKRPLAAARCVAARGL